MIFIIYQGLLLRSDLSMIVPWFGCFLDGVGWYCRILWQGQLVDLNQHTATQWILVTAPIQVKLQCTLPHLHQLVQLLLLMHHTITPLMVIDSWFAKRLSLWAMESTCPQNVEKERGKQCRCTHRRVQGIARKFQLGESGLKPSQVSLKTVIWGLVVLPFDYSKIEA